VAELQNKFLSFHLSGILLIDKPEGPTSAQVVGRVKRLLGAKRVGHLGTLDPFASGLLPLAINEATKIAQLFLAAPKSYTGVIALGAETDTEDSTGRVVEVREVPSLGEREIEDLEKAFTGTLRQTPPMFSAIKQGGVRLYDLARKGQSVPRTPREIRIERLRLWKLSPAELGFEVTCSKGTYIRTLAADMGRFLDCGAHLKSLRRLSCGYLKLEQAVPFTEIERLKDRGELPLLSLNQVLKDLREICLDNGSLSQIRMGRQEAVARLGAPEGGEQYMRLVDAKGDLVALAQWAEETTGGRWRLFRVFAS
jgi:tRNA pseudouridine55 synthase